MRKIMFLIHDLGGGGAEKVLVNLVNHLDPVKFDTTVIALFGGGVHEKLLAAHIHYHTVFPVSIPGNSKFFKLFSPPQLHKICVKDHYDTEVAFLQGPCARVISGCPYSDTRLISWLHGDHNSQKKAASSFRTFQESKRCYERFDQIVCVSEAVKKGFATVYPNLKNLSVCYNVIESDKIIGQKDDPTDGTAFRKDEIKLVAIGKIVKIKGFDRLARIVKRLRDDGLPVHLYALGEGKDRKEIEAFLRENHLEDVYTFLGYQTNPYKYMERCDLFVCASLTEALSTATIEALVLGIPVCTVNVSGMRELLGDNEYGVITENDETALYHGIRYMLTGGNLAYYRKKAGERGKDYNTEAAVKKAEMILAQ